MKQCCPWGKKEGKEKSYHFAYSEQGSTKIHSHLNQREVMGTWEKKETPTGSKKQNKKKQELNKLNSVELN